MVGNNMTNESDDIFIIKLKEIKESLDNIKALVVIAIDADFSEYDCSIQHGYWAVFETIVKQTKIRGCELYECFSGSHLEGKYFNQILELHKIIEIIEIFETFSHTAKSFFDPEGLICVNGSHFKAMDYLLEVAESSARSIYLRIDHPNNTGPSLN